MSIREELREQVRPRAHFACEYCSVSETDTGDQLTVDHFQPQARGGTEALENLVYCCYRCNLYKADYWPSRPGEPHLWNPRQAPPGIHPPPLAPPSPSPPPPTPPSPLPPPPPPPPPSPPHPPPPPPPAPPPP